MRLELSGIYKSFGEKQVLRGIDLSVESGRAFGLLGRNGAGKTTAIRIIMGVFPPDSGTISIDGSPVSKTNVRFGYLPEERGLYPKKTIAKQLCFLGMLKGMPAAECDRQIAQWMERVELGDFLHKPLNTLSKGNQQKVQLIAALLGDPDVVILDEPFSGLDPVNARLLKDIVTELVNRGKIVLFSSHQMSYVEEFCENIAILNGGNIVLSGNLRQIKKSYDRRRLYLETSDSAQLLKAALTAALAQEEAAGRVKAIEESGAGCVIRMAAAEDKEAVMAATWKAGVIPERFAVVEPTLEEIFVEKTGAQI